MSPPTIPGRFTPRTTELALPKEPVSITGKTTRGQGNAKIAVIVYSDFQCPFCKQFAKETWPVFHERFVATGDVVFVFQHLPLERIHPFAFSAATAAECAGSQGQFWKMHDFLFGEVALDAERIKLAPQATGLKRQVFQSCVEREAPAKILATMAEAKVLGIASTPTFLIGTIQSDGKVRVSQRLGGAPTIEAFENSLRPLLRRTS